MDPLDVETVTAAELRHLMATTDLTAVQVAQAHLDRIASIDTCGPGLHAVRMLNPHAVADAEALDAERARGSVRGPLHGIPVLLKDNIDVLGMPTTAGSIALADSWPASDAPLVTALRAAGVVILGKANLSEFANWTTEGMPSGYSSLGGQVLNPYDASVTPSGSSSGSAVAAAAGLAPLTVGSETSGSILSPAQANSLAAVKPTVGLVSRTGVVPISSTQDTAGPMARTVTDAALLLTGMVGVDPDDPATAGTGPYVGTDYVLGLTGTSLQGARLGYVASTDELFVAALAALVARGATLVEVAVGGTDAPDILALEFKRDLNAYLARLPDSAPMRTLSDIVAFNRGRPELKFGQTLLTGSEAIDLDDPDTMAAYREAREKGLTESRAAIDSVLQAERLDAVVSFSATTEVGARAGYPSVTVPAGYAATTGRPGNLVFLGTAFSEAALLAFAFDYEQATLLHRPPSVVNPTLFRDLAAP